MKEQIEEILIKAGIPEWDGFGEAGFDISSLAQEIVDAIDELEIARRILSVEKLVLEDIADWLEKEEA